MGLAERLEGVLGDRYRVLRQVGEGGMATVFLAEDIKHQRQVAIKVLKPELSAVLGGERFLREIGIAAKLQHPHILPLFDSGQAEGLLYYVMPFVEGESLRDRLTRELQLPVADALQIAREVGNALQYAHAHGVVHRDIKPENIMLSAGHAVVADFGIARALDAAGADHLTHTGMAIGTATYMSPEQAGAMAVDGRSDEYSLACTLYEMLAGQPPFTGSSPQALMARHSIDAVPSVRVVRETVPQAVEDAIMRALAKVPADRFPSAQHFVDALAVAGTIGLDQPSSGRLRASSPPRARKSVVAALAGVGVLLLAVVAWLLLKTGSGPAGANTIDAVAVLPFVVSGDSSDTGYLSDGMTEGLIADLAQIGSLKVLSRSSTALAEGNGKSLAQVAQDLDVDAVVKGTILRSSDTVRVTVRLHTADGAALWTKDYQGSLADLPDLQRQITLAISGEIHAKLEPEAQKRLDVGPKVDQQAYEAYLRGRFNLEREELEQARTLFERARQIAPSWAPPYVGLASYYTALPFYTDVAPVEVLPKARAMLVDALDRDETLAEAHAGIAYIRAYYEWDWRAAEREYRRAIELRPSYADAYFSYSRFLASRGRLDEAIAQIRRATELDPLSVSLQANAALLNYFAGRYDTALVQLRETLKTDSTNTLARWGVALVAEQQGRPDEAIAILERIGGTSLMRMSSLGHAYAIAGRVARARAVLDSLRARAARSYVPSYWFALVYAGLGERDQAMQYLERAYQERSTVLAYVRIDPRLQSLRDHPRFVALVRSIAGE